MKKITRTLDGSGQDVTMSWRPTNRGAGFRTVAGVGHGAIPRLIKENVRRHTVNRVFSDEIICICSSRGKLRGVVEVERFQTVSFLRRVKRVLRDSNSGVRDLEAVSRESQDLILIRFRHE